MEFTEQIPISFPVVMCGEKNNPSVLCLHGFLQTASGFFKQIQPESTTIGSAIALQAPFPVFRQRSKGYDVGYSWFFYDSTTDTYLVARDTGVQYCLQVMQAMGWTNSITKVVGYSQGGYLAPFVASLLPNVDKVVGIHCRFRHEELQKPLAFELQQIHGADDQVVDPVRSRESHRLIINSGNRGEFHLLDQTGHELSPTVLQRLTEVLAS